MLPGTAFAGSPVAGHARVAIDTASRTADFAQTANRNSVVILQEWERPRMEALKAANPNLTVLMYKDLSFMMAADTYGNAGTGVTTQQAADHPSWFLLNRSGARISSNSYGYLWAGDIGDRGYQDRWAANVLAKLDGWDGVFMDDTNPTMRYHYAVDQVAKYPSDADYAAATGSALSVIGPKLTAAGKLVIPNFGSWGSYRSAVDPWLKYVSGGMEEQFGKWGTDPAVGYVTGNGWARQLGALQATQAAGKLFVAISHSQSTDAAAARYGWATVLLGAGGKAAFALAQDYTNETWFPEYDYDLGNPTGPVTSNAAGIYRRSFERGLVVVNPTTASVAVDFGGKYSGSGLTGASGATMPSATGLVLLRDGATPVATPTPSPTPTATPSPTPTATPSPTPTATPSPTPTATPTPTPTATPSPTPTATPAPKKPPHKKPRGVRALTVRVACNARQATCHRRVTVKLRRDRRATVGRREVRVRAGHVRKVAVGLSPRGRRALAARVPLKVVVSRVRRG